MRPHTEPSRLLSAPDYDYQAEKALWHSIYRKIDSAVEQLSTISSEMLSDEGKRSYHIFTADSTSNARKRAFAAEFGHVLTETPAMSAEQALECIRRNHSLRVIWSHAISIAEQAVSASPDDGKISSALVTAADAHRSERQTVVPLQDELANLVAYWTAAAANKIDRIPIGFDLDRYALTGPGKLIVVGARPGNCKTTFALNSLALQLQSGYGIAFHCREMSGVEVLQRLISIRSGVSYRELDSGLASGLVVEAMEWLLTTNLRLACGKCLPHIGHIEQWIRQQKKRHDVSAVWIDYLTIIKHDGKIRDRRLEVADITRRLKDLSQELGITVFALAQVNRAGDDIAPSCAMLKEAGDIEQDADSIILLDLPKDSPRKYCVVIDSGLHELSESELKTHLIMAVRKNRNGPGGCEAAYFSAECMALNPNRLHPSRAIV